MCQMRYDVNLHSTYDQIELFEIERQIKSCVLDIMNTYDIFIMSKS